MIVLIQMMIMTALQITRRLSPAQILWIQTVSLMTQIKTALPIVRKVF